MQPRGKGGKKAKNKKSASVDWTSLENGSETTADHIQSSDANAASAAPLPSKPAGGKKAKNKKSAMVDWTALEDGSEATADHVELPESDADSAAPLPSKPAGGKKAKKKKPAMVDWTALEDGSEATADHVEPPESDADSAAPLPPKPAGGKKAKHKKSATVDWTALEDGSEAIADHVESPESDADSAAPLPSKPAGGKKAKKKKSAMVDWTALEDGSEATADHVESPESDADSAAPLPSKPAGGKKAKHKKSAMVDWTALEDNSEATADHVKSPDANSAAPLPSPLPSEPAGGKKFKKKQSARLDLSALEEDDQLAALDAKPSHEDRDTSTPASPAAAAAAATSPPEPAEHGEQTSAAEGADKSTSIQETGNEQDDIDALVAALDAPKPPAEARSKKKKKKKGAAADTQADEEDLDALLSEFGAKPPAKEAVAAVSIEQEPAGTQPSAATEPAADSVEVTEEAMADEGEAPDGKEMSAAAKKKAKRKAKEKAKKDGGEEVAKPAGGKAPKVNARVRAMQELQEARKREEEAARLAEEERIRQEEEAERAEAAAAAAKAAADEARKEARAAHRAQLKKEGKLLTGKAKKEAERLAAMREQLLAKADISLDGSVAETKKKVVYARKKPTKKSSDATAEQDDEAARLAEEQEAARQRQAAEDAAAAEEAAAAAVERKRVEREAAELKAAEEAAAAAKADAEDSDGDGADWEAADLNEVEAPAVKEERLRVEREEAQMRAAEAAAEEAAERDRAEAAATAAAAAAEAEAQAQARQQLAKTVSAKAVSPQAASAAPDSIAVNGGNTAALSEASSDAASSDEFSSEESDSESEYSSSYDSETDEDEAREARIAASSRAVYKVSQESWHVCIRDERIRVGRLNASETNLRSPICCILGHVDTGKTKILDNVRRTNVQDGEAGGITQQIGATYVPGDSIRTRTEDLRKGRAFDLRVPGLLIIDTPGHESFTNLRSRGSSLCDIAILVVDLMHGLEPQTIESINLLKQRKTPFVIALNKVDRLFDWKVMKDAPIQDSLQLQREHVQTEFRQRYDESKLNLNEQGLNVALYWENPDPRRFVNIVPTSAITGEGIPDLLQLLVKLTQSMMVERLKFVDELQATVLEVKVIEGLGTTMDVVLVNGTMREGSQIVVCGLGGAIVTSIRSLLTPHPMKELRVKGSYIHHKEIKAAQGLKIAANGLESAVAGTQLLVVGPGDNVEHLKEEVMSDMADIFSSVDKGGEGVCVQASTLGSLEALLTFLKSDAVQIPVSGINIGPVHKRDVMRASVMLEKGARKFAVILAFDVPVTREARDLAESMGIRIFTADIIYHLFDQFNSYLRHCKEDEKEAARFDAVFPCVLNIVPKGVFNSKDPIVLGVEVMDGICKVGTPVCVPSRGGIDLGRIASIESNKKAVDVAKRGQTVAIKIEAMNSSEAAKLVGRHFDENDALVSRISRRSINLVKEHFKDDLGKDDWRLMIKLKGVFDIQ